MLDLVTHDDFLAHPIVDRLREKSRTRDLRGLPNLDRLYTFAPHDRPQVAFAILESGLSHEVWCLACGADLRDGWTRAGLESAIEAHLATRCVP